jgi:hypothetical protein
MHSLRKLNETDWLVLGMNTEISAWTANPGHFASLIGLGRTYYPDGHPALTEAFLKWFYLENPAGPATLIVAHQGALWTGLIVLIPVTLEHLGKSQRACYAVNVLTHPEHRGKNLFAEMIGHARAYLERAGIWLLGHPNRSSAPGWKRQQMEFRNPLHLYLAKFRLPFSAVREKRIGTLGQLLEIPPGFWTSLTDKPDVRLQYSPGFIAWRFLDAPHRKYTVSAVARGGKLLGLRVTRHFKKPFDLMIDFIGSPDGIGGLLPAFWRPTLVMHPEPGSAAGGIAGLCWKLPVKRQFPFFVTTWNQNAMADMKGITLAASDF